MRIGLHDAEYERMNNKSFPNLALMKISAYYKSLGHHQLPYFENLVRLFDKHKISKSKVFIYVLVQEDLKNADRRVQELHRLCRSFNLYAQAERNKGIGIKPNKLQLEFAQRYVYGRSYKKENFKIYCERHCL